MPGPEPFVSIILLTKNGERYLDEVLAHVFDQKTKFPFEVIAIDSGSADATLAILARHQVRVEQIPAGQFNHGETRNLGSRLARGTLVVYLTQDATPANDQWLHELTTPLLAEHDLAAVTSRHLPRPECNPIVAGRLEKFLPIGASVEVVKSLPPRGRRPNHPADLLYLSNTSAAYRKELLIKYPFPKTDFAEDAWWELSILRRGFTTMFQPKSMVYHSHNFPLIEHLRNSFDAARAMKKITAADDATGKNANYQMFKHGLTAALKTHNGHMREGKIMFWKRAGWLGYGVLWYGSKTIGTMLGLHAEKLPQSWHRWFSRQVRLRQK